MNKIVFVCSGNTCRSPMAEVMLRAKLPGVQVASAGTMTIDGLPASAGAAQEMARRGLSLEKHRSRVLTRELIRDAQVLCMEDAHLAAVKAYYPEAQADTLLRFAGLNGGVPDPYGGPVAGYRAAADLIGRALEKLAAEGRLEMEL